MDLSLILDFKAPTIDTAQISYNPDNSNPFNIVPALKEGTSAILVLLLSEPGLIPCPSCEDAVWADCGDTQLDFKPLEDTSEESLLFRYAYDFSGDDAESLGPLEQNCTLHVDFLQDLVGHKELTEWRGTSGLKCCITCPNVINMQHREPGPGQIATNCWHVRKFEYHTNEAIFAIIDGLKVVYEDLLTRPKFPKTTWDNTQKDAGFNYLPEGLLADVDLRGLYMPVHHTIRDWQHTVVQDGVANSHVAFFSPPP